MFLATGTPCANTNRRAHCTFRKTLLTAMSSAIVELPKFNFYPVEILSTDPHPSVKPPPV